MVIAFNAATGKIRANNEWEVSFENGKHILQNKSYRYIGILNEDEKTISGKWENMTATGKWEYWYNKILIKQTAN